MSPGAWFAVFAAIALAILVVAAWMAWFSRKMVRDHRAQVEDILREMRTEIDAHEGAESGSDDAG